MDVMQDVYDFVVVGSGAGGAALAKELSSSDKTVLLLEKGVKEEKIGDKNSFSRFTDIVKSLEGINIMRAIMAGGTTIISAGSSMRCLERELNDMGIDISEELQEAEREMGIRPLPEKLMSERSRSILRTAYDSGYSMEPMPKCYTDRCDGCGLCMLGCCKSCKWTALDHLEKAVENGVQIEYKVDVKRVEKVQDEKLRLFASKDGEEISFVSRSVIICAGALETPRILLNSGIESAGSNLSVDLLRHVYCFVPDKEFGNEPPMALIDMEFYESKGFILSPNMNASVVKKYISSQGPGFPYSLKNAVGMMIKIKDCPNGRVFKDGTVSKDVDQCDLMRFKEAYEHVRRLFIKMGADPDHIFESHINGAHPACTAAIGVVVDRDLMTEIEGLYVCDASVFPAVPGLPPIVTIAALAKRLGKYLKSRN